MRNSFFQFLILGFLRFLLFNCGLQVYRPKSKELSAFPKPYPLSNRAIGAEMEGMLKAAPSQLGEAVAAGCSGGTV
jgi:hypothetical protein